MVVSKGELVCQVHAKVTHCFVLVEGELEYFLTDELKNHALYYIRTRCFNWMGSIARSRAVYR